MRRPNAASPYGRTAEEISAIMRKVRSRGSAPEIFFRKALREKGLRYSLATAKLPGKPDLCFSADRLALFIDGDFWHGGQWSKRAHTALEGQFQKSASRNYWLRKIRGNMARDCATTALLQSRGWTVLRFWESDIINDLDGCVKTTAQTLKRGVPPGSLSLLPQKTFTEFFAGIGLMRSGLSPKGWSIAFANDLDPGKYKMYRGEFDDAEKHFLLGDVHKIPIDAVPSVTLATASFPCNDLSLAGMRKGLKGKGSSAFWGFIRVLEEMKDRRPPLVLVENVPGFLTSHKGADLEKALLALNRLGYCVDPFILDAAHFVPQSRKRLFIVAVLEALETKVGAQIDSEIESPLRPKRLADFIRDHPEIRWKIRPLPIPPTNETRLEAILEELPPEAEEWWSSERAERLLGQMAPRHRAEAEEMIGQDEFSYAAAFRRTRKGTPMVELRRDGLAGCLRTSRGGSARQILFKAGEGKYSARLLTPRECARLMGADDYKIAVPVGQALFGFGDAVCVPVIEWIAEYYLNPLVNELIRGKPLGPLGGAGKKGQRGVNH